MPAGDMPHMLAQSLQRVKTCELARSPPPSLPADGHPVDFCKVYSPKDIEYSRKNLLIPSC
jgi:hypothetical protein